MARGAPALQVSGEVVLPSFQREISMPMPVAALILLSGCLKPGPATLPPVDAAMADPAGPQTGAVSQEFIDAHMSAHYSLATAARDALFRGNLEGAREPLKWLAEHDSHPGMPPEAMPFVGEMKGAARVALNAKDLRGATNALATVATICGDCHVAMGKGPSFDTPLPPEDRTGVGWHMARHRWAADRMWEGMLQPSEVAWNLGVSALDETPLQEGEMPPHQDLSDDERAVADWLHEMGEFGRHMKTDASKAQYYGELLGNCASCHATAKSE
jgi:cytochrome c553